MVTVRDMSVGLAGGALLKLKSPGICTPRSCAELSSASWGHSAGGARGVISPGFRRGSHLQGAALSAGQIDSGFVGRTNRKT